MSEHEAPPDPELTCGYCGRTLVEGRSETFNMPYPKLPLLVCDDIQCHRAGVIVSRTAWGLERAKAELRDRGEWPEGKKGQI